MKEPLDSRQLRAFVSLAKTGSFTRTGQELFVSQSAISHAIRVLENDVGCQLLHRLGKSVQLTPAGEQFLYHAEKILRDMAGARESLAQLGRWAKGHLRLAAAGSICQYLRRENVVLRLSMELPNIQTIKELVQLNLGVSILAPWVAQPELSAGRLVMLPLGKRHLRRDWVACRLPDAKATLAEAMLVRF